nr:hypothetical protein CFP56_09268 [Quercus suber]
MINRIWTGSVDVNDLRLVTAGDLVATWKEVLSSDVERTTDHHLQAAYPVTNPSTGVSREVSGCSTDRDRIANTVRILFDWMFQGAQGGEGGHDGKGVNVPDDAAVRGQLPKSGARAICPLAVRMVSHSPIHGHTSNSKAHCAQFLVSRRVASAAARCCRPASHGTDRPAGDCRPSYYLSDARRAPLPRDGIARSPLRTPCLSVSLVHVEALAVSGPALQSQPSVLALRPPRSFRRAHHEHDELMTWGCIACRIAITPHCRRHARGSLHTYIACLLIDPADLPQPIQDLSR